MAGAFSDLGPTTPSRTSVYVTAGRVKMLAQQAQELTLQGPQMNVARAKELLEQIKAVLG